jgi:dolichol-phosphate mannosyltransferase
MLIETSATLGSTELTAIAPCYNERQNIAPLVEKLSAALKGIEWEVIFVDDDSPDGTAAEIRALAQNDGSVTPK